MEKKEEEAPVTTLKRHLQSIYSELGWIYNLKILYMDEEGIGRLKFCRVPAIEWTVENQMKLKNGLKKYYVVKRFEYFEDEEYMEFKVEVDKKIPTPYKAITIFDMSVR